MWMTRTLALLMMIAAAACGSSTGSNDGVGGGSPTTSEYYPLKVGNRWVFQVTVPNSIAPPTFKVVTVEAEEPVGGVGPSAALPSFRHKTCKEARSVEACAQPAGPSNPIDQTVGWWAVLGARDGAIAVNYREQTFKIAMPEKGPTEDDWWEPYRLRFDAQTPHMMLGVHFNEMFKEVKKPTKGGPTTMTSQTIGWVVDAVDEPVVVMPPSGAPRSYPHCIKISHTSGSYKSFWYASGIGKVKEVGGQIEELIDYQLAP
jgi:hypothetical protein